MSKPGYNVLLTWYQNLKSENKKLKREIAIKNIKIREQKAVIANLEYANRKVNCRPE